MVVTPTWTFPALLLSMICFALVSTEVTAETKFSQTIPKPDMELEETEILKICHQVSKDDFEYYSENLQAFFNDIQFIPIVTDTLISAYIISYIKENSPVSNYAPVAGDKITYINSKPIWDTENLITVLSQIKKGITLEVSITKQEGNKVIYKYLLDPLLKCTDP